MAENIFFKRYGSGPPVILIHGFPMNSQVWDSFAEKLAANYSVYTPDLPGLGKTSFPAKSVTIPSVATLMNQWVSDQNLLSAVVIGHSMGGYVALEMVKQDPGRYKGFGLFHSTSLGDTDDKKESRTKVVKFIDDNGVLAFTSNFIQPLFAHENHAAISAVTHITTQARKEAVQAYAIAMRDRNDNSAFLNHYSKPVLMIGGDQDKSISAQSLQSQAEGNPNISLHIFQDTGHMGMFERPEESLETVQKFLFKVYNTGG